MVCENSILKYVVEFIVYSNFKIMEANFFLDLKIQPPY